MSKVRAKPVAHRSASPQRMGRPTWRGARQASTPATGISPPRFAKRTVACMSTSNSPPPQRPDNLNDMMPLYHAVAHGCKAGLAKDTDDNLYRPRIRRENEHFPMRKLGAFGSDLVAISHYFTQPWSDLADSLTDDDKGWLLNAAGIRLRALGRN